MPLPITGTTITLYKAPAEDDWGGAPDESTYVEVDGAQIPAVIGRPAASNLVAQEGTNLVYRYPLVCNPCALTEDMMIKDNKTGFMYSVEEVSFVDAPLIEHTAATLIRSKATY